MGGRCSKCGTNPTRTADFARPARVLVCPEYLSIEKKPTPSQPCHLFTDRQPLPTTARAALTRCHRINNPLTSQASTASAAHDCRTHARNNQQVLERCPQPRGRPSIDARAQMPLAAPTARLQVASGVSTPDTPPAPCRESHGGHGGNCVRTALGDAA